MPYKFIGRSTNFSGKPLWEILGNLKNFGVGRLITRHNYEQYMEKSYFKIVKVEALPNPEKPSMDHVRKVRVLIERTFRGVTASKPVTLEGVSYKDDYRLIPKDEEYLYTSSPEIFTKRKLMPQYSAFPPALEEYIKRTTRNQTSDLKLEMVYTKTTKVAKEGGEKATVELANTLDMTFAPQLYKHIVPTEKLIR